MTAIPPVNTPDANATLDFSCTSCGKLLRVMASAAGRQAKCPHCNAVQQVPAASAAPPLPMATFPTAPPPAAPASTLHLMGGTNAAPGLGTAPLVGPLAASTPAGQWKSPTVDPEIGLRQQEAIGGQDTKTKKLFDRLLAEIGKIYVGQEELVLGTLVALFSGGHVLIESVPGLGKTLFVRTLGKVMGCHFGRIQFTADLMPSDITGAPIFDMKLQDFRFRPGPIFTNVLLADEINRSPAKTHAALLEIMQEYRVTIDGVSHKIERPFLVLATQNPIESEGTYNLPEAQLDRFMFKLIANYPAEHEEAEILKLHSRQVDLNKQLEEQIQTITSPQEILAVIQDNSRVRIDERLIDYINKLVRLTREWPQFHMGASPRAGIALMQGARTLAAFHGRDYAVPDDVVSIALPALRHRVILTAEAEVEGHAVDELLLQLIRSVEVPRF